MPEDQQPPQLHMNFRIDPQMEGGVYANGLAIWHTGHEFTLDFYSTMPPAPPQEGVLSVPARVTARVKVPPTVLFDILTAINQNMTHYETAFGPIPNPGRGPQVPPDDLIEPSGPPDQPEP